LERFPKMGWSQGDCYGEWRLGSLEEAGILETGDPVVGYWFPLPGHPQPNANGVWHPEDEVYFSWFARQVPSIGYNGQYTYMGTFPGPAQGC
jgi:hypothetical protein